MTPSELSHCPGTSAPVDAVSEPSPPPANDIPAKLQNGVDKTGTPASIKLPQLLETAKEKGATDAVILAPHQVIVDETLAEKCLSPRCENYGLSRSCPPHVTGPKDFMAMLKNCEAALFFKIDLPKDLLFSSDRRECFRLLHQVASGIEPKAIQWGFKGASAYAGGSCRNIFCYDEASCRVIDEKSPCRHPHTARPSMSGFGVHVAKLMETAGWHDDGPSPSPEGMSHVCGLVLLAK